MGNEGWRESRACRAASLADDCGRLDGARGALGRMPAGKADSVDAGVASTAGDASGRRLVNERIGVRVSRIGRVRKHRKHFMMMDDGGGRVFGEV